MGFTKLVRAERKDHQRDSLKPSTKEELKMYAKRAKARDRAKADGKQSRRTGPKLLMGEHRKQYRDMFARHDKFEVLGANVIRQYAEFCKDIGEKMPRYREYLPRKEADSQFVFEVNYALSKMSWIQLAQLIHTSVNCPVVTRDYSEAYNFAAHALITLILGVVDVGGAHRLTDLSVLEAWPVESMKRPSKEDRKMSKKEATLRAAGKTKSKVVEDDEDEEDLETGDEEADEDEDDEAEEEEEESLDEDDEEEDDVSAADRPRGKKAKVVDEDEDEESDEGADEGADEDEDEDEDDDGDEDEDETPKKRSKTAAKEKTVKKHSKSEKEERTRPAKMKLKGEVPAAKKGGKAKKDKPVKEKKERTPKAAIKIAPTTVLAKVRDRPLGGPKTKLLNLMPKRGIKFAALEKLAKEEGVPAAKITRFATMMVKRGFAKIVE
jgi:hypothetical protein